MKSKTLLVLILAAGLLTTVGCKNDKAGDGEEGGTVEGGIIEIDGSSTVFPINEAVAEEFQAKHDARVTIGVSGTGGGFQKFCAKETDVTGASRPIKPSEIKSCKEAGVEFIEIPVAYDGITVIANEKNDWVDKMTVEELKTIWEPEAQQKITNWSQVREGWPDKKLNLYGPGIASGTFDYFTHAIVGEEQASRGDFTSTEDDNVIVKGVANDPNSLGFLGYAYYDENRDTLKAVEIVSPKTGEPVAPSQETIATGEYQPLSRPLFVYIRKDAYDKNTDLQQFVDFYLTEGAPLVKSTGFIPLPEKGYALAQKRVDEAVTGSIFEDGGSEVGLTVEELLGAEEEAAPAAEGDEPSKKAEADGQKAAEDTKEAAEKKAEGDKAEGEEAAE